MTPQSDPSRSPLSAGIAWASRLTALGFEFVLPALGGYYLDRRWGTEPAATLVGTVLGFGVGMFHLLQMTRARPGS